MVLVDGLPLDGAFWGAYRRKVEREQTVKQLIDQQRVAQRKRLGLPDPPMFRHRSR